MADNIYKRICEVVDLKQFQQVDEFHLSGNYPWVVPTGGKEGAKHSIPADDLDAKVTSHGNFEIQDWETDWETINDLVINATDSITDEPLPNGKKVIGGLHINRNAFGCYRIKNIGVRATVINTDYTEALYDSLANHSHIPELTPEDNVPLDDFIIFDAKEFDNHGNVDLYFDTESFNPKIELTGSPYNYIKIEIVITDLENILGNSIDMFTFDSMVNVGKPNISISESLKNCVFGKELKDRLIGKVLYTIYIKTDKFN